MLPVQIDNRSIRSIREPVYDPRNGGVVRIWMERGAVVFWEFFHDAAECSRDALQRLQRAVGPGNAPLERFFVRFVAVSKMNELAGCYLVRLAIARGVLAI